MKGSLKIGAITVFSVLLILLITISAVFAAIGSVNKGTELTQPSARLPLQSGKTFLQAVPPTIVPAPASVQLDQSTNNSNVQVFDEKQDVLLGSALSYDLPSAGTIPAGVIVDSHYIHLDQVGTTSWIRGVGWVKFDGPIAGVMAVDATLNASDSVLGATGTTYPTGLVNRGTEYTSSWNYQDIIEIDGDTITFDLQALNVMDSIRVITNLRIAVDIDIKPGSYPNCFNNDGKGAIPVAILGSADFDATQIDPGTVTLQGLAIKAVGKSAKLLAHIEDVNGDGFDDLVVQIQDMDGAFEPGSGTAKVTGLLYDGTPFEGSDSICIVPVS